MRFGLLLLGLPLAAQIQLSISPQPAPFPLAPGMQLYSVSAVASSTRTLSASQIRQAAEAQGISVLDPSLNSTALARATMVVRRLVTVSQYSAAGMSVAGATISAFKTAEPTVGNAKTWGIVAAAAAAVSTGLTLAQSKLQTVETTDASITSGVQAALMSDMTALYTVTASGLSKSLMFFGSGKTVPVQVVIQ